MSKVLYLEKGPPCVCFCACNGHEKRIYRLRVSNLLFYNEKGKKNMLTNKVLHMPDDTNEKGFQDSSRININEIWELEFWIKKLQVTKEKLKEAVKAVGSSVTAVQKYLQK